jgi:amino acid transporter
MSKSLFARTTSGLTRDISARDALIFTIVVMCPSTAYIYGIWAAAFYPGVNHPLAVLISIPIAVLIGIFYALYSASMPRTGGDYVWASRVLHPAIGFSLVFFVMFILIAWIGTVNVFAISYSIAPTLGYFGYADLAASLSSSVGMFIVGIIILLMFAAVVAAGTKTFIRVLWIASALQIIGVLTYVGVLLAIGPGGFKANFNALSGMDYDSAISAAQAAGYQSGFTAEGTFLGVVYMILSFTGFNLAVYISGEIKEVRRSQFIAIVGGTVAFGLWLLLVYGVTYWAMGADFVNALSYLSIMGNPAYTLSFTPAFYNLLWIFAANNNGLLISIMTLGYLMGLCSNLTYVFTTVRMVFAWSFDRILPRSFANLDRRFNVPYVALLVVSLASLASLALWLFTPFMSYFAYIVPGWFMAIAVVGISGIIFPYRRKDIFEKSPPIVTKRIAGVPLISIMGVIAVILSAWLVYAGFMPAYAGTINPTYVAFTFSVYIVGFVIYAIASVYRKRTGLPLEMSFSEVPPE